MFKQLKFFIFALFCFSFFVFMRCFGMSYSIHDLSLIGDQSYVSAINQQGTVTGKIKQKKGHFDFIWSPETGIQLVTFPTSSSLPVINNHDEALGIGWFDSMYWLNSGEKYKQIYSLNLTGDWEQILPPDSFSAQTLSNWQTPHLWDEHELAILGCTDDGRFLISDFIDPLSAKQFAIWNPKYSYWSKGEFLLIDKEILQQAYFINNQGIILGKHWEINQKGSSRSIVSYNPTTNTSTPLFIDTGYTLTGFNDAGQVCGWKMTHQANQLEGFLWDPEKGLQSLGNFLPTAINNKGQMVGNLKTDETPLNFYLSTYTDAIDKINSMKNHQWTPCIWLDDHATPLQNFLETSHLPWTTLLSLNGINDKGTIIGHALLDGKIRAIVLTPHP